LPTVVNITGPIATGATTLAVRLAESMSWERVLEADVEMANPFLPLSRVEPTRYTFHNQVTFLCKSAEEHTRLLTTALPGKIYVQDFTPFEHTEVYAYVQYTFGHLSQDEYELLLRLTKIIEARYILPSVLLYRPLSRELLLQRVQQRGRGSELLVSFDFLDAIRQRFDVWIASWKRSPVILVDEGIDVLNDPAAVHRLGMTIVEKLSRK